MYSMTKQVNVRLDEGILMLLDEMVLKVKSMNYDSKASRTSIIESAIYNFANDHILGNERCMEILDDAFRQLP